MRKIDVIPYDVAAKMCQFDITSVCTNIENKDSTHVTYRRKQIGVQCNRMLEFLKVVDVIQDF